MRGTQGGEAGLGGDRVVWKHKVVSAARFIAGRELELGTWVGIGGAQPSPACSTVLPTLSQGTLTPWVSLCSGPRDCLGGLSAYLSEVSSMIVLPSVE